jgi:hypothetical protein
MRAFVTQGDGIDSLRLMAVPVRAASEDANDAGAGPLGEAFAGGSTCRLPKGAMDQSANPGAVAGKATKLVF